MSTAVQPTRYANLRRPKLPGFYGASTIQFVVVVLLAVPGALLTSQAFVPGLIFLVVASLLLAPWILGGQIGVNPYELAWRRYTWNRAARKGQTVLRQGLLGLTPDGETRLPGLAASTALYECQDVYGSPFGLLVSPSPKHYSVAIECLPPGTSGVDHATIDLQAAYWGGWLSELSREPDLIGAAVVIESAPDTGHRLRSAALRGIVQDAPQVSVQVLQDVVDRAPTSSAQIATRVVLTFSGKRREGKSVTVDEMAEDIGIRLPTLIDHLKHTGAGSALRACRAADLTDTVRVAFDPEVAPLVEEARSDGGTGLAWNEAGPTWARTHYDRYEHEGAVSVSHMMIEPPRGTYYTLSLARLLAPSPKVARKRVAILYRPTPAALSATLAEMRVRQAQFEASQSRTGVGRKSAELEAAQRNAQDEAAGSPFIRVGLMTTVTVTDPEELPRAKRVIESMGTQARLRMRLLRGAQDTGFLATLPLGLILADHMLLPTTLRDGM